MPLSVLFVLFFVFFVFFLFDLIRFPPQRKSIKKSPGPISVTLFLTIFKNNKINLWTFDEINATGELNRKKSSLITMEHQKFMEHQNAKMAAAVVRKKKQKKT